jgi:hypothetical protein
MNAFLTPSNTNCPELLFNPLGLKLTSFSGNIVNNKISLQWAVSGNELLDQFSIEKSKDGNHFSLQSTVISSNKAGEETYRYSENQTAEKIYYRIKVLNKQGSFQYSSVISLSNLTQTAPYLNLLNDAGTDDLQISYYNRRNDFISLQVYTISGSVVYSQRFKTIEGMNLLAVPSSVTNKKGLYIIEVVNREQLILKTKVFKR